MLERRALTRTRRACATAIGVVWVVEAAFLAGLALVGAFGGGLALFGAEHPLGAVGGLVESLFAGLAAALGSFVAAAVVAAPLACAVALIDLRNIEAATAGNLRRPNLPGATAAPTAPVPVARVAPPPAAPAAPAADPEPAPGPHDRFDDF